QSTRYTMDTPIYDTQVTWTVPGQPPWTPPNFDGGYHGICALERCMGNSYNIPAVKVEATLPNGVKDVVAMARTMGAPPTADGGTPGCPESANVPDSCFSPAITLGAYKETPLAMATGASVLGAAGVLHTPYGVDHVETAEGQEIFKANPGAGSQVIDPKVAWIMESIMSDPANRNDAFGATLNQEYLTFSNHRVGVKTGTTDDYKDSWTVGYTPSLATAVWFGNTDDTKMNSFGESVFTAAPAWHSYMQAALDHLNTGTEWFTQPPGLTTATGWHGQTIYLLPGTTATQAPPPLPPDVHSNGGPSPTPSPTPGASPQTSPGPQPSAPDPSPKA
ncbi:MAG TPA: penicillin-binding transpeptidase domain-containing protein, partial [Candidatus Dormibacteraeota bacterium]|nr:penicillin-binding transpeptidase domain-containing protein [Candidatus Dormibacteraeota bacterium]